MRLLALVLGTAIPAPSPSPAPPALREEIVVTAERSPAPRDATPAAVTVLDRARLERLPAQSLAEVLEHVPGLHVLFPAGFGGTPMVASRGFFGGGEAEYVLLLVDGVPVGDPESGVADWRRVRAAEIERVEVLHGPGSALYGDVALGGVVQVFTRASAWAERGSAAIAAGRYGTVALDASYAARRRRTRLGLAGTGSRTGGHRPHSEVREGGLDGVLSGIAGGGLWALSLSGTGRDREEPGALPLPAAERAPDSSDPRFRFDRERTGRARAAATWRREGTWGATGTLALALRDTALTRTLLLVPELADRARRDLSTLALSFSAQGSRELRRGSGGGRLRVGIDAASDALDTAYFAVASTGAGGPRTAAASGGRARLAAYATQDWRLAGRLRVSGGLRWDRIRDEVDGRPASGAHEAWSPRLGATLRLGPGEAAPLVVYVQAARAFKAATLDQILDPRPFPDFQGGAFTLSNPALAPQRARSLEAGLRREGRVRWSVAAYRIDVDDEIDFDPATFRYVNIGRSRHLGLEASVDAELGRLAPHASYAWSRVQSRSPGRGGHQLKNVPEHVLRAGLGAALPARVRAGLRLKHAAGRFLDDANRFPLEPATVLDVRLERALGRVTTRLDLLNVAGERHPEVGFVLPDLRGGEAPFVYPSAGFAFRLVLATAF